MKSSKEIQYYPIMNREDIAQYFNKLHFPRYRLQFVKQLEIKVSKVEGHWPNNTIPNVNNDHSSNLLLKLDEKWLGL